jgi:hypothetical protein
VGRTEQWFQDSFTVTVTTDPNDFLVFVDGAFETALNDNQAHAPLYENLLLNPGDSLHLDLKARFSDNFVKTYSDADLPIEKTALYFTITLANGSIRDEVVDLFYLPDFADGDAGDGVWTMMDTLDGKTRTLSFDNAAQVDVKPLLNQSGLFAVDVIGDIAQGIKYQAANPSAVEDFADYQIEEGGRNLGKITGHGACGREADRRRFRWRRCAPWCRRFAPSTSSGSPTRRRRCTTRMVSPPATTALSSVCSRR